jgi:predicted naringenin-chalcone synthase
MELFNQFAPELALAASNDCLQHFPESAVDKITHVITFSCTGMSAPGLDLQLAGLLGLPSNIERTCINFMGCYAAVNALKSAWHIARSAPDAVILIAGVELCTLHYQRHKDAEHLVSNALFGDGAAAAIISSGNFSSHKLYEMNSFHAEFFPEGDATMVWKINEDGFDLKLDAYVPALIEKGIPGMTENAFAKMNISKDAIRHFALHPGGVRILEACERALNLTKADTSISHSILNDFGNMSSVTILFVLKALAQKARRNEKVFACAFGPGLTMESLILTTN